MIWQTRISMSHSDFNAHFPLSIEYFSCVHVGSIENFSLDGFLACLVRSAAACGGGTNNRSIQFDWITFCFSVWIFFVCKKTVGNHDGDSSIGERRRDWELHWVVAHICALRAGVEETEKSKRREKITEEVVEYCGYVLREISIVRQRRRRVLFKLQWISKEIFSSPYFVKQSGRDWKSLISSRSVRCISCQHF